MKFSRSPGRKRKLASCRARQAEYSSARTRVLLALIFITPSGRRRPSDSRIWLGRHFSWLCVNYKIVRVLQTPRFDSNYSAKLCGRVAKRDLCGFDLHGVRSAHKLRSFSNCLAPHLSPPPPTYYSSSFLNFSLRIIFLAYYSCPHFFSEFIYAFGLLCIHILFDTSE